MEAGRFFKAARLPFYKSWNCQRPGWPVYGVTEQLRAPLAPPQPLPAPARYAICPGVLGSRLKQLSIRAAVLFRACARPILHWRVAADGQMHVFRLVVDPRQMRLHLCINTRSCCQPWARYRAGRRLCSHGGEMTSICLGSVSGDRRIRQGLGACSAPRLVQGAALGQRCRRCD